MNIFDIETGPVPEPELARVKPTFTANRSYKDPAKIAADLAEKEAAWRENAALSAVTGRVLAIGMIDAFGHTTIVHDSADEAMVIRRFWLELTNTSPPYRPAIWGGFGIFHFDLPFLIRRSWRLGLKIPPIRNGRYWSEKFVDLREVWQCGDRRKPHVGQSVSRTPRTEAGKRRRLRAALPRRIDQAGCDPLPGAGSQDNQGPRLPDLPQHLAAIIQ